MEKLLKIVDTQFSGIKEDLGNSTYTFEKEGGKFNFKIGENGITTKLLKESKFLYFDIKIKDTLSALIKLNFYKKDSTTADFYLLIGLLPAIKARFSFNLSALDGQQLFLKPTPGTLKQVVCGTKISIEEIDSMSIEFAKRAVEVTAEISDITFADCEPDYPLDEVVLCDKYGKSTIKHLDETFKNDDEFISFMLENEENSKNIREHKTSEFGGCIDKKLCEGTGFFKTYHDGKRWWLVDPLGYAFISTGLDCIGYKQMTARTDGIEHLFDGLEDKDGKFAKAWSNEKGFTFYDYGIANMIRAFGNNWQERWEQMTINRLKDWGINTVAAWSDYELAKKGKIPYAITYDSFAPFPTTEKLIFRDFPDVYSHEYEVASENYSKALEKMLDDKYMIGYFMRNEPQWAFVENICIAEQMLAYSGIMESKKVFVKNLTEKYSTVEKLNQAWNTEFSSFEDLYSPIDNACSFNENSKNDLNEFSTEMVRRYVTLPAQACKKVDKNHLNLGMRYAFVSDESLLAGWENFDVFSINTYAMSPYEKIDEVAKVVTTPVIIGEFHFGAIDSGMYATGLRAVASQAERAKAYKFYMSEMLRHPAGVGAHYFTIYDQSLMGRFDGENYQIGVVDVMQKPYEEFVEAIIDINDNMYDIADKTKPGYTEKPEELPRIAY